MGEGRLVFTLEPGCALIGCVPLPVLHTGHWGQSQRGGLQPRVCQPNDPQAGVERPGPGCWGGESGVCVCVCLQSIVVRSGVMSIYVVRLMAVDQALLPGLFLPQLGHLHDLPTELTADYEKNEDFLKKAHRVLLEVKLLTAQNLQQQAAVRLSQQQRRPTALVIRPELLKISF